MSSLQVPKQANTINLKQNYYITKQMEIAEPASSSLLAKLGVLGLGFLYLKLRIIQRKTNRVERIFQKLDEINAADPRKDGDSGIPQDLLYAQRMTQCLMEFAPNADELLQIAARGQVGWYAF